MTELASRYYSATAERFAADTDGFVMTVLHDDGLYRHVRFKHPERGTYRFELITWPGHLTITGDVATYTFARCEDMFEFFSSGPDINPGYWGEKLLSTDTRGPGHRAYSPDRAREHVEDAVREVIDADKLTDGQANRLRALIREEILDADTHEETFRAALDAFRHDDIEFFDTWEWDLKDWTWSFMWSCCAIRAGIREYREASPE